MARGGGSLELGMLSAGACLSPLFPPHLGRGVRCGAGNVAVEKPGDWETGDWERHHLAVRGARNP